MKVLFNTSNINNFTNFKAGKTAALLLPTAEAKLKEGYTMDVFYKKSDMFLKNKIDKKEFLDEFYKFYDNAQAKKIKLTKDEKVFLANVSMSLDLANEDIIQDKFLKKDIKRLLDVSGK